MNFFDTQCQTPTNAERFGICDDDNDTPANINFANENEWIVTIINKYSKDIVFTAIDYCIIILRENGDKERSCDCMITYSENIVFIELKNKTKGWKEDGIDQLEKTLEQFVLLHNLQTFKHKRAFVANRKHPNFQIIENATMKRFFDNYKVRLNIKAEIEVK